VVGCSTLPIKPSAQRAHFVLYCRGTWLSSHSGPCSTVTAVKAVSIDIDRVSYHPDSKVKREARLVKQHPFMGRSQHKSLPRRVPMLSFTRSSELGIQRARRLPHSFPISIFRQECLSGPHHGQLERRDASQPRAHPGHSTFAASGSSRQHSRRLSCLTTRQTWASLVGLRMEFGT
jgi:hypothetical protein